jgi:2-phosphosulfolactate phosphatase
VRVKLFFTVDAVDPSAIQQCTVAVVDVLRATSTIVEALANGARAIYPTAGSEEAIKLASSLGRDDTLLCGERRALKIEGYDLGNSPREFTPEKVGDKRLVMNTTNGTRTFLAATGASRVVAASFLNMGAVARSVGHVEELAVLCAGREGRFALDDAICAGMLLHRIGRERDGHPGGRAWTLDDAATAALALAEPTSMDTSFLAGTEAGEKLKGLGLGADVELCARLDRHDIVPEMHDRMIQLT